MSEEVAAGLFKKCCKLSAFYFKKKVIKDSVKFQGDLPRKWNIIYSRDCLAQRG